MDVPEGRAQQGERNLMERFGVSACGARGSRISSVTSGQCEEGTRTPMAVNRTKLFLNGDLIARSRTGACA